jgi:hypothetical protein
MADREMDPGDGGAAAITAGLVVVALVVVGFFFFFGFGTPQAEIIDLDTQPASAVAAPAHLVRLGQ